MTALAKQQDLWTKTVTHDYIISRRSIRSRVSLVWGCAGLVMKNELLVKSGGGCVCVRGHDGHARNTYRMR
jgi:hypothetical protein